MFDEAQDKIRQAAQDALNAVKREPLLHTASLVEFVGLTIAVLASPENPVLSRHAMEVGLIGGNGINIIQQAIQVAQKKETWKGMWDDVWKRSLGGLSAIGIDAVCDTLGAPKVVSIPLMGTAELLATKLAADFGALRRDRDHHKREHEGLQSTVQAQGATIFEEHLSGLVESMNEILVAAGSEKTWVLKPDDED